MKGTKLKMVVAAGSLLIFGGLGFWITSSIVSAKNLSDSGAVYHLNLTRQGADPSIIAITKGDYVEFDVKDGKQHQISQGSGDDEAHQQAHNDIHEHLVGGKQSGVFGPSQGYRVQFHQTGTFSFHDHFNPKLSLTVVVYESHNK